MADETKYSLVGVPGRDLYQIKGRLLTWLGKDDAVKPIEVFIETTDAPELLKALANACGYEVKPLEKPCKPGSVVTSGKQSGGLPPIDQFGAVGGPRLTIQRRCDK